MPVVKYHPKTREFVAEPPPPSAAEHTDISPAMLQLRIRQQRILAEFGVEALKGTPFAELLDRAARLAADGLQADFAKVLQYLPLTNRFLVCAGVGWGPDVVGKATVGADLASPAGYALQTGKAVISNHLDLEERFRTPELLIEHGIRRAMNVILGGEKAPFGVLEVDSRDQGEFNETDIVFLRGISNILGMAIERQRIEDDLRQAVERQQIMMKEVNHRVHNSLQIVSAMLALHSSHPKSEDVRHELCLAGARITAVARAHRRLYSGDEIASLDLGAYLGDVCSDLASSVPGCDVNFRGEVGIVVPTDRAIPAALAMTELVTNAVKYAYPSGQCKVWVVLSRSAEKSATISVRDEGVGLPVDFDAKTGGLGMRLIEQFAKQLRGNLQILRRKPGTEFVLSFPSLV